MRSTTRTKKNSPKTHLFFLNPKLNPKLFFFSFCGTFVFWRRRIASDKTRYFITTTTTTRKERMGDAAAEKEFTKEERALLKFQKKQQHGQVCLVLVL